jgi:hypothetical protein
LPLKSIGVARSIRCRNDIVLKRNSLCPTGEGDRVELLWWSHRDRWDQIGDFGPMVMPLDEALDYIVRDPIGCFWH